MSMPLRQSLKVGTYLFRQKLARREKFPLLVELEPLFACNLKCAGCGKIQHPHDILKQRMPVEQALAAIEECGATRRECPPQAYSTKAPNLSSPPEAVPTHHAAKTSVIPSEYDTVAPPTLG